MSHSDNTIDFNTFDFGHLFAAVSDSFDSVPFVLPERMVKQFGHSELYCSSRLLDSSYATSNESCI